MTVQFIMLAAHLACAAVLIAYACMSFDMQDGIGKWVKLAAVLCGIANAAIGSALWLVYVEEHECLFPFLTGM